MLKHIWLLAISLPAITGNLTGTVTIGGGQPAVDATVTAYDPTYLCIANVASTSAGGNYTLEDLPDGPYYLQVGGDGFQDIYFGNGSDRDITTATLVNVSGNTNQNLTAIPGGRVSGTVTVNGGSPSDTRIQILDPFGLSPLEFESVLSADGSYTIEGIAPGCYLIGAVYDPNDLEQEGPQGWYDGALIPDNATQVEVGAGDDITGVDVTIDVPSLGVLRADLDAPMLMDEATITLIESSNRTIYSADITDGISDIYLPAGTYRALLSFTDNYVSLSDPDSFTVPAGGMTQRSYAPSVGGSVSGTLTFDPLLFAGQSVLVEVVQAASGSPIAFEDILLTDPAGFQDYLVTNLPDGTYTVRVSPVQASPLNPIPTTYIQRIYFGESASLGGATTFTVANGSNHPNFVINLVPGATISGIVDTVAPFGFAEAIEVDTGEVYQGTSFGSYIINGLPPGRYKVGNATGYLTNSTLGLVFDSFVTGLFCGNLAPSFYQNADDFASASVVNVGAQQSVENINLGIRAGGGVTGRVLSADCNCPVSFVIVGVFDGDRLVRAGLSFDSYFQIGGLDDGTYTLRTLVIDVRDEDLFDLIDSADDFTFATIFDLLDILPTSSQTVQVTSGSFVSVGDWCIDLQSVGDPGNGNNGTDETTLVYPWVSNNAGQFASTLIANNTEDQPVTVTLTATRNNGESQTVTRQIPADGFLREEASSLFDVLGSGPGYTVVLTTESDDVYGRWVTNNLTSVTGASPSQGVAVRIEADDNQNQRAGRELMFGYLPTTNDFISAPVVVNVGDGPTTVTLRYYDENGIEVDTQVLEDLQPNRPFAQVAGAPSNVTMTAESDREWITGVAFVFNSVGETAIGNATAIDLSAIDSGNRRLLYPWVSNNANQFESIVIADNYSDQSVTVTLTARRRDGTTSAPVMRQIPPRGFLEEQASSLFPDLGSGPGYSVELTADSSKVEGQWVTNNLTAASMASPSQGVAVDIGGNGADRAGTKVLFGYLPLTDGFISAPVVVNTGNTATDITLTFYDTAGNLVATDTTTLAGSGSLLPFATVAENLVPAGTGDVMMIAETGDGTLITGVVFVFNGAGETAIGNVSRID